MSREASPLSHVPPSTVTIISTLKATLTTEKEKEALTIVESTQPSISVEKTKADSPATDEKAKPELTVLEIDDWEHDPDNARNWPLAKKWVAVSIVSFYTFISPFASTMMAPGLPEVAMKYHISNPTIVGLTLSIFLLSFALAPLVAAPLSEIYGRTWVLHISNLLTVVFNLGCAFAPTTWSLIAFRFLAGLSASTPMSNGGASIADLFSERDRGTAMAVFTLGPLMSPVLGPTAGGFIAQNIGVKWVFIVIAALASLGSLIGIPFLCETYAPTIQLRKFKKQVNDPEKATKLQELLRQRENKWQFLAENFVRPLILLTRSFICFILSLYAAFIYGIYYLMFSTFAELFSKTYGFQPGVVGLTYLGLGVGFFIATTLGARGSNKLYKRLSDKNDGKGKPEMRIPVLFIGSLLVPVGLFWYGWSAQAKTHWIMPIIGTGIFGAGVMTVFFPITLYLVDTFTYAASAAAAASVFRSLLAFVFPLFGQQMYGVLGLGGGNSLLAGLAIVLGIPFPVWLYYKGEAMRARSPLTRQS